MTGNGLWMPRAGISWIRWRVHTFDFDAFCLYLLRLMILEKWAARSEKDAPANLDKAADRAEHAEKDLKQS